VHDPDTSRTIPRMTFLRAPAATLLALSLALSSIVGGCATACPAALLEGTLVAADGDLVVETDPAGVAVHVQWPFGVGVHQAGDELVVSDALGSVKAREGDRVAIGGSATRDGEWVACGDINVTGGPRSPEAPPE
jgi:hypothetical protein